MANALKVTDKLAAVALDIFKQTSVVAQNSMRSLEDEFTGSNKIGDSVRAKVPSRYELKSGNTRTTPNAIEQRTRTLTLNQNKYVHLNLTSQELAVFSGTDAKAQRELLEQPLANLARFVDTYCFGLMAAQAGRILVKKTATEVSYKDVSQLNAAMATQLAPRERLIAASADDLSSIQQSQAALLNPDKAISDSYEEGIAGRGLGFSKWFESQSTGSLTVGTCTSAQVNGTPAEGDTSIPVDAITGTIKAGQAITFAGVYGIDPQTLTGIPTKYTAIVAADVANGGTAITITRPLYTKTGDITLANVSALPANDAAISVIESGDAGKIATNVIGWTKKAFALAFMELPTDLPGAEASRMDEDGVSIRIVRQFEFGSNSLNAVAEVQCGGLVLRPEWIAGMRGVAV